MKTKIKESETWFGHKWLKYGISNNVRGAKSLGIFSILSHPSLPWITESEKALLVLRSNFRPFCSVLWLCLQLPWKESPRNIIKFKHCVITVCGINDLQVKLHYPHVKQEFWKRTYLCAKKVWLYLKNREKRGRRDIYRERYKMKHKSYFAKHEKLANFEGC